MLLYYICLTLLLLLYTTYLLSSSQSIQTLLHMIITGYNNTLHVTC